MEDICYNAIIGLAIPLTVINLTGTALVLLGSYHLINWLNSDNQVEVEPEVSSEEVTNTITDNLLSVTNDTLNKLETVEDLSTLKKEQIMALLQHVPIVLDQLKVTDDTYLVDTLDNLRN